MTREIKFRAWDGDEMYIFDLKNEFGLNIPYIAKHDRVMQYTGLKDKNGKEIYFGDILNYIDIDGNGKESCVCEVVETMTYGVGILADNVISDLWEDEGVHEFEIIGNIYENPELLENHG